MSVETKTFTVILMRDSQLSNYDEKIVRIVKNSLNIFDEDMQYVNAYADTNSCNCLTSINFISRILNNISEVDIIYMVKLEKRDNIYERKEFACQEVMQVIADYFCKQISEVVVEIDEKEIVIKEKDKKQT